MAMKTCMNIACGTTSCGEWKTGWSLRSGDLAILCDKCGYAFEQRIYCEEFHSDDSGWRECVTCSKRVHCGCIASLSLIELLDGGGVKCIGCARNAVPKSSSNGVQIKKHGLCTVTENNEGVGNHKDKNGSNRLSMLHSLNINATSGMPRQEGIKFPNAEAIVSTQSPPPPLRTDTPVISGSWTVGASWASTLAQSSMGSFLKDRNDGSTNIMQTKNDYESVTRPRPQPNLNISLASPGKFQFTSGIVIKDKEQRKTSNAFNQVFLSPSLPTPPKFPSSPAPALNTNMSSTSQLRVAKSPFEGRGRHQLLPRYWPRITEQELQQISGDPNCTITPLFEKVLSASDAGRIGRLVLPKACAEAYFPPISQAEGLPIKIQDVKGREWVFQFRFWPNNNSRMYVLEGVTPCIQSMQLQAGDTVTFSRKDPDGKLIMGFRKASPSMQDVPATNGSSSLPQSSKGITDTHMNVLSRQLDSSGGNANLLNGEKFGELIDGGLLPTSATMAEKKKGRNIGAKGKRLLIDNQDVQALRLTWEEVQGMLRPPPNAKPNIVEIDGFEIEEYDEPPVIGKSSVFGAHPSGSIDQWAQCDSCSKWRRLPAEFLIPPRWTCVDNASDPARCFCSAPDELSPEELERFANLSKDSKKKRTVMAERVQEQESSGLSALANAAGLGDDPDEAGTSAAATTTKHPRHRLGCSCIVCIQPPSGKGKHDATCTCTVCMTVKRRFRTLMMRKKKRQSDQEAGTVVKPRRKKKSKGEDDKAEVENAESLMEMDSLLTELTQIDDSVLHINYNQEPVENSMNGQTDLTSLLQFVKQNGLTFWPPEEQTSAAAHSSQIPAEIEGKRAEELSVSQAAPEEENPSDGRCEPENADKLQTDSR
ncbi:hypothetical protein vseg_010831 [Gypsophila vaccaria]